MARKISFFIGSMHGGGAERVISILANNYCKNGWNVDIVLLLSNKIGYELDKRINIVDLSQSKGSYYKRLPNWLKKIRSYVKTEKPERIVSFIGRINILVLTACLGLKVPIIVSERNDPKRDGRGKLMLNYCNLIYKKAKAVVYQTNYEKSCFSNKLKNGVIIANPVSVSVHPKSLDSPYEIVTAGRLQPQKNHKMLIEAVSEVIKEYHDVTLKIYGDGYLKDQLQKQINDLQVAENIELCGNVSDLHERINGTCIFVMCSEFEGLSNALIEAMMLGIVCISTDYPGADEVIVHGNNGLIVKCDDANGLSKAIKQVLSDKELRNRLSVNAIEASMKYSESRVIELWKDVINS